jgi:hypothetical protein
LRDTERTSNNRALCALAKRVRARTDVHLCARQPARKSATCARLHPLAERAFLARRQVASLYCVQNRHLSGHVNTSALRAFECGAQRVPRWEKHSTRGGEI